MARLLVIRHGETAWNREQRFQGARDVPLNEKGRQQASLLAAYLGDKPLAAIYSSPLSRAVATAEAVAAYHSLTVRQAPGLSEINVGEWEGLNWEQIWAKWPQLGRQWHANPQLSPPPPGGEDYTVFQERSLAAMEAIAAAHTETDYIAVVCHGGVIRAVLNHLLGLGWGTRGRYYSRNCSINRLRWQPAGPVIVDSINDVGYLNEEWR